MQTSASPLLPIFRSRLQGDLLARVLGEPGRRFSVTDLAVVAEIQARLHQEFAAEAP